MTTVLTHRVVGRLLGSAPLVPAPRGGELPAAEPGPLFDLRPLSIEFSLGGVDPEVLRLALGFPARPVPRPARCARHRLPGRWLPSCDGCRTARGFTPAGLR